ncbi:MAG TPA: PP2C family protein-serine/threonine phosphatase [Sedimentisphaerales bacterium]|nr:PP2C family protein-serine/threonine phosphatase [Sedimentisphaerales bacterium]
MTSVELRNRVEVLRGFTDVLYLTNQSQMPSELRRLLKSKKLSCAVLGIDRYPQIRDRLDLVGTAVIDAEGMDASQQQRLAQIIESLESEKIGVVLLTGRVEMPVKSFSLSPSQSSFSMVSNMESVSVVDLWVRISMNLAYRKKSEGMAVKPAGPPQKIYRQYKNNLAEQLHMTEALVGNLAEQLRLAGLVQQDFLPAQLPNTEKIKWATVFQPAEWVSGDIYDVVRIDERHIGFYIADAVGHGLPAALLTIFLKQALVMRHTIENDYRIFPPVEVVKNLNVRMAAQKLSGYQFATCCYCLLNTETHKLTYCRAGHPYPILMRPGKAPEQLEARGSLLGVFAQAEFVERTVQLEPGDKLFLYSDGADRFIGNYDDQAGFHFNEDFCELNRLSISEIMDKLTAFAHNKEIGASEVDDITAVGLEIL